MSKIRLIIISVFFHQILFCQNNRSFSCSFNEMSKTELCISTREYITDKESLMFFENLVGLIGIPQNFVLIKCNNINNALDSRRDGWVVKGSRAFAIYLSYWRYVWCNANQGYRQVSMLKNIFHDVDCYRLLLLSPLSI